MGWKGTVRSVGSAIRAAERESKRRQRELERQQKHYEKMKELEQAAYLVEVYENHINVIQSIHKECSPVINWNEVAASKSPKEPKKSTDNQDQARLKLDAYTPGFVDRLFKKEESKKKRLSRQLAKAIELDDDLFESEITSWETKSNDWKESIAMANALIDGNSDAKIEAIDTLTPFSEISNLGTSISISVQDNGLVEATIHVHGTEIVPSETKSLLKSGRLSVKNMAKGAFNEIYQDYVCSAVLRVGNELFSAIPDKLVIVTAVDELLNSKTGHLEDTVILSVAISRETIDKLNLDSIDPSVSMSNFKHNMNFKKTKGFDRVERIDSDGLDYD